MNAPAERTVADVLVIAVDANIESLVGELVAFAGHRPVYDVTGGAAGESLRRARPDVALIDTALPQSVLRACLDAASESGSRVVLVSSNGSDAELRHDASVEHALYFTLPGGPRQLRVVLDRALELTHSWDVRLPALRHTRYQVPGSVHPALCAALATVARARLLVLHSQYLRREAAVLRDVKDTLVEDAERSRAALRAAVVDFAAQLREADVDETEALEVVRDTVSDCAGLIGAHGEMDEILAESSDWTRAAYRAA